MYLANAFRRSASKRRSATEAHAAGANEDETVGEVTGAMEPAVAPSAAESWLADGLSGLFASDRVASPAAEEETPMKEAQGAWAPAEEDGAADCIADEATSATTGSTPATQPVSRAHDGGGGGGVNPFDDDWDTERVAAAVDETELEEQRRAWASKRVQLVDSAPRSAERSVLHPPPTPFAHDAPSVDRSMSAVEGERGGDALLTNLSATFEQEAANTTTRTPTEGPPAAAEPALSPPAASAPPASERWAAIPSRIIRETIADLEKRAAQRESELQATQQLVESLRTTLRDEQQSRSGLVSQMISLEARVRTLDEQGDEGRLRLATVERERDRLAAQVLRMQEEAAARLQERDAGVLTSAAYQELNAKLRNAHEELDIVKLERDILERKLQAALNGQPPETVQAVGTETQKENVEATPQEARRAITPLRPAAGANDATGRTPTVSRRSAFKPNHSLNESQEPSLVRQRIQAFDSKLFEAHEKKRVRGDRDGVLPARVLTFSEWLLNQHSTPNTTQNSMG